MGRTQKPAKPYKEYPLFAHQNGQWAKKIRGKIWYFGAWENPEAALETYLDDVNQIQAGRDPRRVSRVEVSENDLTIAEAANLFLEAMDARLQTGEISRSHFRDCKNTCHLLVAYFGRRTTAASVRAADFAALKSTFPASWGVTKTGTEIQRIRSIFRWAANAELIPSTPNFGPEFRKPPKVLARRERNARQAEHGTLDFSAGQIQQLLAESSGWMKACILLGINAGFGASDCGRLTISSIDFDRRWYDLARHKTGVPRRFRLWPETADAIRDAFDLHPDDQLCFLSSHGKPVWWESARGIRCDNVGKTFTKLLKKQGLHKPKLGFYSLRRTYETVAGNSRDQIAVNYAMGHADESMAAVYRQGIDDRRLTDVSNYVRNWIVRKTGFPPGQCPLIVRS